MQTLEQAQETNRRLNRRLAAVEAPWQSLVSQAFFQAAAAQETARKAQESSQFWLTSWQGQLSENYKLKDRVVDQNRIVFWVTLYAIAMTGVAIWLFWR